MVKGYKVFNPDWTCRGFQYNDRDIIRAIPNFDAEIFYECTGIKV